MSTAEIRAVVFDADGTLFDTERLARDCWLDVAREWGAAPVEAHYMELIGRNHLGIATRLQEVCGLEFPVSDFLLVCSQRVRDTIESQGVPVKAGAPEILRFLHSRGVPVALATSSGGAATRMKLERTGLAPYFQAVLTGDMVSIGKPHPEIFLSACEALHLPPACCLAVEDSPNGIRSAHGAGMRVVMIPDLIPPSPELDALLFQKFDSLDHLRDYLEGVL